MEVTVFSTSNCAVCHAEMQWLEKEEVKYTNIVIDEDTDGLAKMMEVTGGVVRGTPLTVIAYEHKKDIVVGFDRPKLQVLLGLD